MMKRVVVITGILLALGGCAQKRAPLVSSESVKVLDASELPVPDRRDIATNERPYLIGPFDKLVIDVFGVQELSKELQADASGRISMPLVGTIDASGKTPEELASLIEGGLRGRYVRNPQVTVNLKETVSQVFTVDGQVKEPGLYPVIGRMSLMRAIATAKGASEFAALEDVVVFRTVNEQRLAALYDLKAIRRGTYKDPEIFPNDVIVVGDSPAKRMLKDIIQVAPTLAGPLIVLLRGK